MATLSEAPAFRGAQSRGCCRDTKRPWEQCDRAGFRPASAAPSPAADRSGRTSPQRKFFCVHLPEPRLHFQASQPLGPALQLNSSNFTPVAVILVDRRADGGVGSHVDAVAGTRIGEKVEVQPVARIEDGRRPGDILCTGGYGHDVVRLQIFEDVAAEHVAILAGRVFRFFFLSSHLSVGWHSFVNGRQ